MKYVELKNGVKFPAIGYGTFLSTEGKGTAAIQDALDAGYRYFDTASFYGNEEALGQVFSTCDVSRDELQICSKLWKTEMGYDNAIEAVKNSLKKLKTNYLDLYLIHWPKQDGAGDEWKNTVKETWRAMEHIYKEGLVKAIGLSNFLPHHVDLVLEDAKIRPMVDQLELHVGYMQPFAVDYCRKNDMLVQAWSPLGRSKVLTDPICIKMAEKYNCSVARFLLTSLLQQDIMVLPKASSKDRVMDNFSASDFTISDEDMKYLLSLPQIGWSGEHPDIPVGTDF